MNEKFKINDDKLLAKLEVKPHEGQENVLVAIKDDNIRDIVLVCGRRWGKALDIRTPILTTDGWKEMEDINNGDYVFGEDGNPTKVIETTEIMENHKCFRITFSDGYEIITDANHEWVVEDKSFRKNSARTKNTSCKIKTKTTEELSKDYIIERKDGNIEANYSIPTCKPLQYKDNDLKINPYVLGSWLGDGHSNGSGFTTADVETVGFFKENGYDLIKVNSQPYGYRIFKSEKKKKSKGGYTNRGIFLSSLKKYNLVNNKHIPEEYRTASYDKRLELLQGLMDTDGYCDKDGSCEFCGVNAGLVNDVYDLIISLGIKAVLCECDCKLYGRLIGRKYRINFTTDLPIFKLQRKLERLLKTKRKSDVKRRFIKRIVEVESVPVKCIMVDNTNHQYLAGRNLIPTHNSFLMAYTAFRELFLPNRKVWIVAPTSDLTQKVFTELIKFVGKFFEAGEYNITTKPYPKIRMANGSQVECKTADNPVSLIGDEVDLLIIDEAARIAPMIYERELAATTMTRKGKTVFISTPKGLNWFWMKYKQTQESSNGFVYNAPSSDNPLNTPEELDKLRKMLPEAIYNQEYNALFIDEAGAVFRNINNIVNDDCLEEKAKVDHRYIIGVDLAKMNDYTVLTCVDKQTHKVVAWERMNKIDYGIQKIRILTMARKYNNAKLIVDSTGIGNPIVEDLRREKLMIDDFKITNKSKQELIQKLSLFIEEESIFIPNNSILIDELKSFGIDVLESGTIRYTAPSGMHDDAVISLGLAVWGLYTTNPQKEAREYVPPALLRDKKPPKRIHR